VQYLAWIDNAGERAINMKALRTVLSVVAFTLLASHFALADTECVPEVNPAMGMTALAFLSGAVMVIRGRKKA
jgi:hypothetical protein